MISATHRLCLPVGLLVAFGSLLGARQLEAAVTGFVNNRTTNSTDWANEASGVLGADISLLDFATHPVGALDGGFFSGVALSGTGDFVSVQNSAGPANPGSHARSSNGEGVHGLSNILGGSSAEGMLTATFDRPVAGFGVMTIDLYNPFGGSPSPSIEAFDSPNGTGNSLGSFIATNYEFQQNFLYFMGLTSDSNDIRSVKFTSPGNREGDTLAIADLRVATLPVPEPSGLIVALGALLGIAARRQSR